MTTPRRSLCPVCGWPELAEPPRGGSGGGSYEICPSCGFQFGVSDEDRGHTYEAWRKAWQAKGAPWSGKGRSAPKGWDPATQLKSIGGSSKAG